MTSSDANLRVESVRVFTLQAIHIPSGDQKWLVTRLAKMRRGAWKESSAVEA
jgi:hypothetical protein